MSVCNMIYMKVRQSELHLSRISANLQVEIHSTVQVKVQVQYTRENASIFRTLFDLFGIDGEFLFLVVIYLSICAKFCVGKDAEAAGIIAASASAAKTQF